MKILNSMILFCTLAFNSVFAIAEDTLKNADSALSADMASQQELIDIFIAAAKTGNQEVILEFLKHGFPVDVRNHAGYTALMMAAYYGHQDTVTTLVEHGADRCARDSKGNTALMGAIFKLEWAIVKQLRQVDCDVNAKSTGQKTVEEFAKLIGQDEKLKSISLSE